MECVRQIDDRSISGLDPKLATSSPEDELTFHLVESTLSALHFLDAQRALGFDILRVHLSFTKHTLTSFDSALTGQNAPPTAALENMTICPGTSTRFLLSVSSSMRGGKGGDAADITVPGGAPARRELLGI